MLICHVSSNEPQKKKKTIQLGNDLNIVLFLFIYLLWIILDSQNKHDSFLEA